MLSPIPAPRSPPALPSREVCHLPSSFSLSQEPGPLRTTLPHLGKLVILSTLGGFFPSPIATSRAFLCPYHPPGKDFSPTAQSAHLQLSEAPGLAPGPISRPSSGGLHPVTDGCRSRRPGHLGLMQEPLAGHLAPELSWGLWGGLGPPASSLLHRLDHMARPAHHCLRPPQGSQTVEHGVRNSVRRQAIGAWAGLLPAWLAVRTHHCCRWSREGPGHKAKVQRLELLPVMSLDHTAGREHTSWMP